MRERGSTIERVLAILEEITDTDQPLSASEINQSLQLPRSTAHRLCSMMEEHAFLQRHAVLQRRNAGREVWRIGILQLHRSRHRRSSDERGAIRRGKAPRGSRCKRSLRKCAIPHSSDWNICS